MVEETQGLRFNVENLSIVFFYMLPDEDLLGEAMLTLKEEDMKCFLNDRIDEEVNWNTVDYADTDWEAYASFLMFGEYDIVSWLESGATGLFNTANTDLQILIYEYLMFGYEGDVDLEYSAANPFWFLHDICHARHDVQGSSIYVNEHIEEDRMFDGLELARELGMLRHVNGELITTISKGFKDRWDYNFATDKALNYLNQNT